MLQTRQTRKNQKIQSRKFPQRILLYSSPRKAQRMAYKYLGKTAKLYPASNREKKYMIYDPKNNKWINFGQMGYEDYTKHRDKTRRKNYLTRTKGMLGDWKRNRYSANNLSRHILWT
jgi:N-acetylneuraminic acid mutarotase